MSTPGPYKLVSKGDGNWWVEHGRTGNAMTPLLPEDEAFEAFDQLTDLWHRHAWGLGG